MPRVTNQKTRQALLVTGDPLEDIDVLPEKLQLFNEEGEPLMIGGSYTRTTLEHSTASLAQNATAQDDVVVQPGWRLFEITTNRPARVRAYRSAAQRTADLLRPLGQRPVGNHGRLFEAVTLPGMLGLDMSPTVDFMSNVAGDSTFYFSIENRDTVTGVVTVTFDYVRTE